jgi:rod shape-determining protein MreD
MIKKAIFLILGLYFLTLLQTSFFVSLFSPGIILNFVLILVAIINIFEKPENRFGIFAAFLGGFYLDVFSLNLAPFFGFYALISVVLSFFIKFILRKYVQIPLVKKY